MVGEPLDLGDVVGDVEDRYRERLVKAFEKRQHLVARRAIESGDGLVHQKQARLRHERPADRHALALAARQVLRRAVEQPRQAEQLDRLVEPDRRRRAGLAAARGVEQVAQHRQVRKQARLLEDVADRARVRRAEHPLTLPGLAHDAACAVETSKSGRAAQHRRLAAARRAEYRGDAARRRDEGRIEREAAQPAGIGDLDRVLRAHSPVLRMRFSISIIARMTAKANTTIPPARMLASRQRSVSTKS